MEGFIDRKEASDHYIKNWDLQKSTFNKLSPASQKFYEKYHIMVQHFKKTQESLPLIIVFYLIESLRNTHVSTTGHNKSIPIGNASEKVDEYNEAILNKESETTLGIENLREYKFGSLDTSAVKKTRLLTHVTKKILQIYTASLTKEEQKSPATTFSEDDMVKLAVQVGTYLEKLGVIQPYTQEDQQTKYYKINDTFLLNANKMLYYSIPVMFISQAKDWKLSGISDGKGTNLSLGGFHMNTRGIYPGVHLKSKHAFVTTTQKQVDIINYLQKQKYSVNKPILEYLLSNDSRFYQALFAYIDISFAKEQFKWEKCFTIHNGIYELKDLETFLKADNDELISTSRVKDIREYKEKKYGALINQIVKFYFTMSLSYLLRDQVIFFQCFLDGRGRVYYYGHGLNPQGDSLSKTLLALKVHSNMSQKVSPEVIEKLLEKNKGG